MDVSTARQLKKRATKEEINRIGMQNPRPGHDVNWDFVQPDEIRPGWILELLSSRDDTIEVRAESVTAGLLIRVRPNPAKDEGWAQWEPDERIVFEVENIFGAGPPN